MAFAGAQPGSDRSVTRDGDRVRGEAARPAPGAPLPDPGPAAAGPLGLGLKGGGGLRRGPRPPGSTNFSASSSSILLLFFSLKERENKRRVSIKLHRGRRKGMGGQGDGAEVGESPGGSGDRPLPRSLTTQPNTALQQNPDTYGSSPSAILFPASSQRPSRRVDPPGRGGTTSK